MVWSWDASSYQDRSPVQAQSSRIFRSERHGPLVVQSRGDPHARAWVWCRNGKPGYTLRRLAPSLLGVIPCLA
jgi:hypothetical protein